MEDSDIKNLTVSDFSFQQRNSKLFDSNKKDKDGCKIFSIFKK